MQLCRLHRAYTLSPSFPRRRESRGTQADSVLTLVPRLRGDDGWSGDDDGRGGRVAGPCSWKVP